MGQILLHFWKWKKKYFSILFSKVDLCKKDTPRQWQIQYCSMILQSPATVTKIKLLLTVDITLTLTRMPRLISCHNRLQSIHSRITIASVLLQTWIQWSNDSQLKRGCQLRKGVWAVGGTVSTVDWKHRLASEPKMSGSKTTRHMYDGFITKVPVAACTDNMWQMENWAKLRSQLPWISMSYSLSTLKANYIQLTEKSINNKVISQNACIQNDIKHQIKTSTINIIDLYENYNHYRLTPIN